MVSVDKSVHDGLEFVRSSGLTNMFNREKVMLLANEMGYYDTVVWINENRNLYYDGILKGFVVNG